MTLVQRCGIIIYAVWTISSAGMSIRLTCGRSQVQVLYRPPEKPLFSEENSGFLIFAALGCQRPPLTTGKATDRERRPPFGTCSRRAAFLFFSPFFSRRAWAGRRHKTSWAHGQFCYTFASQKSNEKIEGMDPRRQKGGNCFGGTGLRIHPGQRKGPE